MKNMKKLFIALFAVVSLIFAMQISASAATWSGGTAWFSSCTDTTITVRWNDATYSTPYSQDYYYITGYYITNKSGTKLATNISPYATGYTFSGLSKGTVDYVKVYATYDNYYRGSLWATGWVLLGETYVNTTPANMKTFTVSPYSSTQARVTATPGAGARGTQIEVTNIATGNKSYKKFLKSYASTTVNMPKDKSYRVRVRSYYINPTNGKYYYGSWTTNRYCANASISGKAVSNKKGFTLTLKKIPGVKNFYVYLSKSSSSGYVKSATVTVTGTKKTVRITKIGSSALKKKTRYYVKVVPMFSVNGTAVASKVYTTGSIFNYK